jgi:hypothetical protein
MPPWLTTLLQILEQVLAGLTQEQAKAATAGKKKGCDPDCDIACLTLCSATKSAEASRDSLKAYSAFLQTQAAPPPGP